MERRAALVSIVSAPLLLSSRAAFAEPPRVTLEAGKAFPPGTQKDNFTSESDDPADAFRNRAVLFRGWQEGGSKVQLDGAYLAYRLRMTFPRPVRITAVSIRGAGHQGKSAQIRLLDGAGKVLATRGTTGVNVLATASMVVKGGATGTSFVLEEYDYSTSYRYRDRIEIAAEPLP